MWLTCRNHLGNVLYCVLTQENALYTYVTPPAQATDHNLCYNYTVAYIIIYETLTCCKITFTMYHTKSLQRIAARLGSGMSIAVYSVGDSRPSAHGRGKGTSCLLHWTPLWGSGKAAYVHQSYSAPPSTG